MKKVNVIKKTSSQPVFIKKGGQQKGVAVVDYYLNNKLT